MTRREWITRTAAVVPAAWLLAADEWKESDLVKPAALAERLKSGAKPMILQVGFAVQFKTKHIPGAIYAGPGRTPEGIETLKKAVADIAKDREIVVYCGCCPWDKCPNMKPAFAWLRENGFKNVKALVIPDNFGKDWADQGYPTESAAPTA